VTDITRRSLVLGAASLPLAVVGTDLSAASSGEDPLVVVYVDGDGRPVRSFVLQPPPSYAGSLDYA